MREGQTVDSTLGLKKFQGDWEGEGERWRAIRPWELKQFQSKKERERERERERKKGETQRWDLEKFVREEDGWVDLDHRTRKNSSVRKRDL